MKDNDETNKRCKHESSWFDRTISMREDGRERMATICDECGKDIDCQDPVASNDMQSGIEAINEMVKTGRVEIDTDNLASNTRMVDSKVSTINHEASNTVSFFNVANLIVSTLKYDYLRKLPAYRVDEIRARIELALSEVASLKDKRIAELEEHNRALTGERFSERNHMALQSRIASLESSLEGMKKRNAELRDANAEVLRDKMELEAKLQTAVKRNTKLEKELERVLSDWDADRGRKLYLEKQLKTAEDKLAEVTKEKEDHPYNRNCGCILCRNH